MDALFRLTLCFILGMSVCGCGDLFSASDSEETSPDVDGEPNISPPGNFVLNMCKAKNYYASSKSALDLSNEIWCGDFTDRFVLDSTTGLITDFVLEGTWSPQSEASGNSVPAAQDYCEDTFGTEWRLPTIYELLSLHTEETNSQSVYLPEQFNYSATVFTSSIYTGQSAWTIRFGSGSVATLDPNGFFPVRCFNPDSAN